jgi:hypothetical protein
MWADVTSGGSLEGGGRWLAGEADRSDRGPAPGGREALSVRWKEECLKARCRWIRSSGAHAVVVIPRFSELPEKHLRRVATIPSALAAVSGARISGGKIVRTRLPIVNRLRPLIITHVSNSSEVSESGFTNTRSARIQMPQDLCRELAAAACT